MSRPRTTSRILAATATVALLITAPGLTGAAMADDNPTPQPTSSRAPNPTSDTHHESHHAQGQPTTSLSPELNAAVKSARDAYGAAARTAKVAERTEMDRIRALVTAAIATQRAALDTARAAYAAAEEAGTETSAAKTTLEQARTTLHDAIKTVRDAHRTEVDAARAGTRTTLDAARATYVAAVTNAFSAYAPGTTVPPGLLTSFGQSHRTGPAGQQGQHR